MTKEVNLRKIKKTIIIGIFVSLAATIRFEMFTSGFIIAMSVAVMAIFIYCYEDLSPAYIAFCSGICSPLVRFLVAILQQQDLTGATIQIVPDMVFFFTYGLIYTGIFKYIIKKPKSIKNFPYVVFLCDLTSNIAELVVRSIITGANLVEMETVAYLALIAVCRTVLVQGVALAIETHSNLIMSEENDKAYKKLMVQASIFESELHVMEKNSYEIEEIMKKAFSVYKAMENSDVPKELADASLEISRTAHEIKGDYLNIVGILKDSFVDQYDGGQITMSDILSIEKYNLQGVIRNRGYNIDIVVKLKSNFRVREYFKMMSIIRNLLLNGIEAIGDKTGRITINVAEENEKYMISVRDNGRGIAKGNLDAIFFDGFSTKFDDETGNIQRGLGLNLVKDYVENEFHGIIQVESEKEKYTEFTILLDKDEVEK